MGTTIRIDQLTAATAIGSVTDTNVRRRTMRYNVGTDADTHTPFQTFLNGLTAGVQHDIEIDGVITLTAGLSVQRECRFHPVGHGSGIAFGTGSYINVSPISWTGESRGTLLTVSITKGTRSFTIPSGVSLAVGDIVIISSFDQITPTGNHAGTTRSYPCEVHRILNVNGSIATVSRDFRHAFTTTNFAMVKKEAWHKYTGFEGINFYYTAGGAILMQGVDRLAIRDCTFHGPMTSNITLNGVLDARISGNTFRNGVDAALYGLIVTLCADSRIEENDVNGWWHEWHTTSAAAAITEATSDGSVADIAALKALPVAGLTNGKSYTVTSESALRYVWKSAATSGLYYPDDKTDPTTTPGFWIPKSTFHGCNDYSISRNKIVTAVSASIASSVDPIATHFQGTHLKIYDNEIHVDASAGGSTSTGIALRSRDTILAGNRIFGGGTAIGIQLRGVGIVARDNILTDCMHGIQANSTIGEAAEKSGTLGGHIIRSNVFRNCKTSDIVIDAGHASDIINNRHYGGCTTAYTGRPAARLDIGESGCNVVDNYLPRNGIINHSSIYLRTGKSLNSWVNNSCTGYGESLGIGSGDGTTPVPADEATLTRDLMPQTRWDYETPRISSRFITASNRIANPEEPGYEGGSYTPDPLNPEVLHLANGETRILTCDDSTNIWLTAPSGITLQAPSDPVWIPGGRSAVFKREGSILQQMAWKPTAYDVVPDGDTAITFAAGSHANKQLNCNASGGNITVTIDTSHGCTIGDDGYIVQADATRTVTVAASGVTFQPTGSKTTTSQWDMVYWKCVGTNTFFIVGGQIPATGVANVAKVVEMSWTMSSDADITTGVKVPKVCPVAGTIIGVYAVRNSATSGTTTIDLCAEDDGTLPVAGDTICASDKLSISSTAVTASKTSFTGWTLPVTRGMLITPEIEANNTGSTWIQVVVLIQPTE